MLAALESDAALVICRPKKEAPVAETLLHSGQIKCIQPFSDDRKVPACTQVIENRPRLHIVGQDRKAVSLRLSVREDPAAQGERDAEQK